MGGEVIRVEVGRLLIIEFLLRAKAIQALDCRSDMRPFRSHKGLFLYVGPDGLHGKHWGSMETRPILRSTILTLSEYSNVRGHQTLGLIAPFGQTI